MRSEPSGGRAFVSVMGLVPPDAAVGRSILGAALFRALTSRSDHGPHHGADDFEADGARGDADGLVLRIVARRLEFDGVRTRAAKALYHHFLPDSGDDDVAVAGIGVALDGEDVAGVETCPLC